MPTGWWHQATHRSDEQLCTGTASCGPAPICGDLVVNAGRSDPPLRIVCIVSAGQKPSDTVMSRLRWIALRRRGIYSGVCVAGYGQFDRTEVFLQAAE